MLNALIASAPDFGQPIAVLKHCHDRIRKQLNTLHNLLEHLPQHGNDAQAQQAAHSLMRYFNQAAKHHHADEEVDLLPVLRVIASGEDAALLDRLMPEIMAEHQQMDSLWQALDLQLKPIAAGKPDSQLSAQYVQQFSAIYLAHMEKEETWIAPMAKRLFNEQQMQQLGSAMQQRRGISG
ncbi:hemerythrin domain-containing protein [Collimonas sp.]|jgi:hemerythrin-like domain-containing protein|uniref:hemerythrin domain-containing protein n=1 Tax=Collimonas sp. TaxID=1963772 RepID=UPI0037BFA225